MVFRPKGMRKKIVRANKEHLFLGPVWKEPFVHHTIAREDPGIRQSPVPSSKHSQSRMIGVAPFSEDPHSGVGRFSRRREDLNKLFRFLDKQGIQVEEVPYTITKVIDEYGFKRQHFSYLRLTKNGKQLTHEEIAKLVFDPAEIKKGGSYRRLK